PTTTPGVAAKGAATTGVYPTTTPGVAAKGAATTGVCAAQNTRRQPGSALVSRPNRRISMLIILILFIKKNLL
ncbi:MAG TPA: hypothetical protein PLZ01_14300, partial [bacterium]|nr:hypothetical protein [bacterium]